MTTGLKKYELVAISGTFAESSVFAQPCCLQRKPKLHDSVSFYLLSLSEVFSGPGRGGAKYLSRALAAEWPKPVFICSPAQRIA